MFRVIPAVDIKGRKVVQLVQGMKDRVTFEANNPVGVAKRWVELGARVLHVIDLDGAFEGRLKHESIIAEISKLPIEIQVGGGIRDLNIARRLLEHGVSRVILGTIAVRRVDDVREFAKRFPGRVMIAIDSRKGKVTVEGWTDTLSITPVELGRLYDDLELSFLYTNVDVEGLVSGINTEKIAEVVESLDNPVYVAGGVSTPDDVRYIKRCGAAGVVIGSALYTGKLKFEEVLKIEHEKI
jgi:phosphoribosylformimino-5-aminoimidazole carboxamide ribotide isomerase